MLLFVDVETTGVMQSDRICSIGILSCENEKIDIAYDLVNDGKKIDVRASSIHHITNEMIQDKGALQESQSYDLLTRLNSEENSIVTHDAKFLFAELAKYGFEWRGKVVDTQRVTKHLIPECEYFSLQTVRYELKLYQKEEQELAKLGLDFSEMASPKWFKENPKFAWAFYGHRLNLYRDAVPHNGFKMLLALVKEKNDNYFIFTSNVDGQFHKAGFNPDKFIIFNVSIIVKKKYGM